MLRRLTKNYSTWYEKRLKSICLYTLYSVEGERREGREIRKKRQYHLYEKMTHPELYTQ